MQRCRRSIFSLPNDLKQCNVVDMLNTRSNLDDKNDKDQIYVTCMEGDNDSKFQILFIDIR